jgi:hypothetical protein
MDWIDRPDHNLDVEDTWKEFVRLQEGKVLSDDFGTSPDFANADFWFDKDQVVIELKEIQTEFLDKKRDEITKLIKKDVRESNLSFSDAINCNFSDNFNMEYIRLVRPAIARILKKANKQIKETKQYLGNPNARGVVVVVNDGFTSISARITFRLICNILANSNKSIDGFVLMTVNSYVAIESSDTPATIWVPCYSPGFEHTSLPDFINDLGREWRKFIQTKTGTHGFSRESDDISIFGSMPYMNRVLDSANK